MALAILLMLSTAWADCMSGTLSVWPEVGSTLPQTGQIVLQAYGSDRPQLADLKPGDLALIRGKERIALDVSQRFEGSFMDNQVVLSPHTAPSPGTWTLEVRGEALRLWNGSSQASVSWTFEDRATTAPDWTGAVEIGAKERAFFGCGPGVSVVVQVPTRAQWVEVSISETTVRQPVVEGQITLGHGMCAGLLEFQEGQDYTASLVPIAADGRRGKAQTLSFVAP